MNLPTIPEALLHRRARRRVSLKLAWAMHALVYVLVNGALMTVGAVFGASSWVRFPLAGWGLGLAIHGLVTLVLLGGDGLRDRLLADEIARLRARR